MLRRLPISLRFDDEDSDFYYGFIEQKKNDRELSTLILDLLRVYYENEIVRNLVDEAIIRKSPYMAIHEELERIAFEHNRQKVSTSMLGDFTENEKKRVSDPPEPVKKEENQTEESLLMLPEATLKELQSLRDEVSQMKDMKKELAEMKKILTSVTSQNSSSEVVEVESERPPMIEVRENQPSNTSVEVSFVEKKEKEEKDRPDIGKVEKPVGKKPASFGKLLKSVK